VIIKKSLILFLSSCKKFNYNKN